MPLTQEEIDSIKDQLREQVSQMPEDKKAAAMKQIDEMSSGAIESLVKQQKSMHSHDNKSIFRMIIDKEIDAVDVAENKAGIAVLDINPISKGHSMIIPKKVAKTAKDISTQCFSLAKKLSKNITSKLQAKSTEIQTETKFGETIIHVIPIYDVPLNINSQRHKTEMEELKKTGDKIRIVKKVRIPKIKPAVRQKPDTPAIQLKRHIA